MNTLWPTRPTLSPSAPVKSIEIVGLAVALLCALGCSNGSSVFSGPLPGPQPSPTPDCTAPLCFANSSNPATLPWPQSVAVADFNGDGKLDLAVPVYSIFTPYADANILLGNGDGTFKAGPVFPLIGQNVNNIVVADFNGDGKPDLAISLPDANEIQVLLGNGDGSFTPLTPISVNSVYVVATGDFNQDGKPDLVTVNPGVGTLTVLLGNGDGTFTATTPITTPSTGPGGLAVVPVALALSDLNGDGILDIAVANCPRSDQGATGSVTILLGKGDGTFTAVAETPNAGGQPLYIAAGDFNGDGIPDLVVTDMNQGFPELGNLTVLLGNGDGTFTASAESPETGAIPYSVMVADFNGDGKPDLAIANAGSNTIGVYLGNGDGTFAEPLTPAGGIDPIFAAIGDFNGDSIPDIAAADNSANSVTVLLTQRDQSASNAREGR
jgi:hypothetical protein